MSKLGMLGASWNWGQSTNIELLNTNPQIAAQILNVSLPTPAVCIVALSARYVSGAGPITALTANFSIGVGRTSIPFQRTWLNVPAVGVPFDFILPAQPVTALQLDVTVIGNPAPSCKLVIAAELAPITSVYGAENALQFGMALPGEADGLDDDMFDELDESDPEYADHLRELQENGVHPGRALQAIEEVRFQRRRPRHNSHAQAEKHQAKLRHDLKNWNGRHGR